MGEKLKQRLKQDKFKNVGEEALMNLFLANNCLKKKVDVVCAKYGITNAQYNVLRILRGIHPDGYPRCEIIARMIDQAPDVTRIIDNLEKQKLITRTNSKEDRRLSITIITQRGLDILELMENDINSVTEFLKDSLSETEINQLSVLCEKIYGPGIQTELNLL